MEKITLYRINAVDCGEEVVIMTPEAIARAFIRSRYVEKIHAGQSVRRNLLAFVIDPDGLNCVWQPQKQYANTRRSNLDTVCQWILDLLRHRDTE